MEYLNKKSYYDYCVEWGLREDITIDSPEFQKMWEDKMASILDLYEDEEEEEATNGFWNN